MTGGEDQDVDVTKGNGGQGTGDAGVKKSWIGIGDWIGKCKVLKSNPH